MTSSIASLESQKALSNAYEQLILKQLLPLIEKGLTAAVYSSYQMWKTKAMVFLLYDRKVLKFDKEQMKAANQEIYKAFKEFINIF